MLPLTTLPAAVPIDNGAVEGEYRRDRAHTILHARRPALIRRIQRAYLGILLDSGPATTDPLRALVPIPAGIDPRVVGAAIRALAIDQIIFTVNRERSKRAAAHARWLDVWSIRNPSDALAWLASNPELPEPEEV